MSLKSIGNVINGLNAGKGVKDLTDDISNLSEKQKILAIQATKLTSGDKGEMMVRAGVSASAQNAAVNASFIASQTAATAATTAQTGATTALAASSTTATAATTAQTGATTGLAVSQGTATGTTMGLSAAFKGLWATMKPTLIALATNPLTWMVTAGVAAVALEKSLVDYTDAHENLKESMSSYESIDTELEGLKDKAESYKQTIRSIGQKYDVDFSGAETLSDMISTLNNADLTLMDQAEVDKIESANSGLETQIKLQEQLLALQGKEAIDDAKEAMGKKSHSVAQSVKAGDPKGEKDFKGIVGKVTDTEAVKEDLSALKEYENAIPDLEKNITKLKKDLSGKNIFSDDYFRKNTELANAEQKLEAYKEYVKTLNSDLSDRSESIQENLNALKLDPIANAESIKELEKALDSIANKDLTGSEKQLKSIQDFFDKSTGNKFISEQLSDMASKAELTADDILRMGIAIDGVDASEIAKYFNDMAKSANEAADAVTKFGTLDEYEAAIKSENAGDDYLKITEGLGKTKELYDKGLLGTDDFKSFAKMFSPSGADDPQNFIENYNNLKRYFTEDSSGPQAFLSELSKHADKTGKAFATLDQTTGQWKIDIDDTTEAAKALGMGIVPFESLLGRLKDYGFDIDFRSAVQDLSDVQTALNGFDDLLSKMEDGDKKTALQTNVDEWKKQLPNWEKDLGSLDTDVVLKIKMEYSLAEIQAKIDEFKKSIDWGNATSENYAGLLSGNDQYINTAKENLGFNTEGFQVPVQYQATEDSIAKLKEQLHNTTNEEDKVEIQAKIANLQELQKDFLDAFSEMHPEINAESSPEEVMTAWNDFLSKNETSQLFADMKVDTSEAEEDVKKITSEKPTIHMVGDVSMEEVQNKISSMEEGQTIVFDANVDGVAAQVSVVKNADGSISYYANVNNVLTEINRVDQPDGTVTFTADTQEVNAETAKTDGGQRGVIYFANTAGLPTAFSALTRYVNYKVGSVEKPAFGIGAAGVAGLNGTAHKSGTAGLYPIPKLSGRALALGSLEDDSWLKPNWKTKRSDVALTGEVGQELVVHGNRWWTVGDNGAEFSSIPKGSVVFNAKQTKDLFKNGFTPSHGKAYLSGTAYAGGATGGGAFGGGLSSGGKKKPSYSSKTGKSSKSSNSAQNAANNAAKAAEDVIDWIATLLDRVARQTEIAVDAIDTAIGLANKQAATAKAISQVQNEINTNQQAYNRYLAQANSVGLSENYASQVRNGSLNIESISDENLKKKIDDYEKW